MRVALRVGVKVRAGAEARVMGGSHGAVRATVHRARAGQAWQAQRCFTPPPPQPHSAPVHIETGVRVRPAIDRCWEGVVRGIYGHCHERVRHRGIRSVADTGRL